MNKHIERYAVSLKKKPHMLLSTERVREPPPRGVCRKPEHQAPRGSRLLERPACPPAARQQQVCEGKILTQGHEWQLPKPATARTRTKALTIRDTTEVCAGKIIGCLRFTLKY